MDIIARGLLMPSRVWRIWLQPWVWRLWTWWFWIWWLWIWRIWWIWIWSWIWRLWTWWLRTWWLWIPWLKYYQPTQPRVQKKYLLFNILQTIKNYKLQKK